MDMYLYTSRKLISLSRQSAPVSPRVLLPCAPITTVKTQPQPILYSEKKVIASLGHRNEHKMCKQREKVMWFFYKCGHIIVTSKRAAKRTSCLCSQDKWEMKYIFDLCGDCILPPKARTGAQHLIVHRRNPRQNVYGMSGANHGPLPQDLLWEARKLFWKRYREVMGDEVKKSGEKLAKEIPLAKWKQPSIFPGKSVKFGDMREDDEKCQICWGFFSGTSDICEGMEKRRLPCGHVFGLLCLIKHYESEGNPETVRCILCRWRFLRVKERWSHNVDPVADAIKENILSSLGHSEPIWMVTIRQLVLLLLFPVFIQVMALMGCGSRTAIAWYSHPVQPSVLVMSSRFVLSFVLTPLWYFVFGLLLCSEALTGREETGALEPFYAGERRAIRAR